MSRSKTRRTHKLLSHQAGLPAIREPLPVGSAFKWDVMTDALAKQEPWWEPGTKHGYHAFTYGWLLGEAVRRTTGETLGARRDRGTHGFARKMALAGRRHA